MQCLGYEMTFSTPENLLLTLGTLLSLLFLEI